MATRRRGVTRPRITTRSSKIKQQPERLEDQEQATTASSQKSIIANTKLMMMSPEPCSPSPVEKSGRIEVEKDQEEDDDDDGCNGCSWSTPKAKRFRIPEIESCPPAPKKQRAATSHDAANNFLMRRSSIPFFTPPDQLAEFFFRVSFPNMSTAREKSHVMF